MPNIAVLTCTYRRPDRMCYTFGQLAQQTMAAFDVVVINNSPLLQRQVERSASLYLPDALLVQNSENLGAFARNEWTHRLSGQYDYFVWLDDDIDFDEHMMGRFLVKADPHTLWGMDGFRFHGADYWHKQRVQDGEACDFVYVACCLFPASMAADSSFAQPMGAQYRRLDGMHLCYHAARQGYTMRKYNPGAFVVEDGRDTYLEEHTNKIELLDMFRRNGWGI